jgi:hypothetical protein
MKSLLLTFLVFWNIRKFHTLKSFQPDLKVLYRLYTYKLCTAELAKASCQTSHNPVFNLFKMCTYVYPRNAADQWVTTLLITLELYGSKASLIPDIVIELSGDFLKFVVVNAGISRPIPLISISDWHSIVSCTAADSNSIFSYNGII